MSGNDALKDLLARYDDGDAGAFLSERDVFEELKRIPGRPAALAAPMERVYVELGEEAEWGGRGDAQEALEALVEALRNHLAGPSCPGPSR